MKQVVDVPKDVGNMSNLNTIWEDVHNCVKNYVQVVSQQSLTSYLYQVIPVHVTWMCGKTTAQALTTGS